MNVALTLTAVAAGAVVANHVEVVKLLKQPRKEAKPGFGPEELCGAVLRDCLTGESWEVYAKVGCFCLPGHILILDGSHQSAI